MSKFKIFRIISLSLNTICFIMVLITIILKVGNFVVDSIFVNSGLSIFLFFTILSNAYLALTSLVMIPYQVFSIRKQENQVPLWLMVVHFTAVVSVMITCLVTLFFLMPTRANNGNDPLDLIAGLYFLVHLAVPVLAMLNFCVLMVEPTLQFRWTPFGLLPLIAYAIFYMLNIKFEFASVIGGDGKAYYDWYGLFGSGDIGKMVIVVLIMLFASYLISFVLWLMNLICRHLFKGYDDDEGEEITLEDEEPTIKEIPESEKKTTSVSHLDHKYKDGARTYHISRHLLSQQWQVKLAHGEKAIKLFATQAEAITFAKGLVKTQGGSIRVHSLKGKIRKQ